MSGTKLLMMFLFQAPYQMIVSYSTQIMLFICVEHLKDYVNNETGNRGGNEIICGRHKKQKNLRLGIHVIYYAILGLLVP